MGKSMNMGKKKRIKIIATLIATLMAFTQIVIPVCGGELIIDNRYRR